MHGTKTSAVVVNSLVTCLTRYRWIIAAYFAVYVVAGGVEFWMGRSVFGPDGQFGWWETNIWSRENSQRFADPYSFSHFVHGVLIYGGLWLVARRLPVRQRLLLATLVEAGWELLENSPFIINRYREATISLGYVGDSVLNSLSDILMMTLGFLFAYRIKPPVALATVFIIELGCAWWIRDNLTLNIIMLIHPVEAIKHWQMGAIPAGG
jgi:hypothetical protein